ncbi:MAG: DNA primase [Myxococcota bacterium]
MGAFGGLMAGMVSERAIEEIKQRTSLVSLIGEHLKLTRTGRNHRGLCPFHSEKSPSFYVHDDQGYYYCFGCSARGDAIGFLTDHLGYSFREALEFLSERTGIPLPEEDPKTAPQRRKNRETKDRCYELNTSATRYFQAQLGTEALGYLRDQRGLSDEMIAQFELGWAPDGWDGLSNSVASSFQAARDAVAVGLIAQGSRGHYDKFRARIMFPVFARSGSIAGFSGRTLSKDKEVPKYINSSESEIFTKGKLLYGLFQARKAIRAKGRAIVVEGNVDVITLAQAGFAETVAPMGTALTEDQCHLIKRFSKHIILIYDGDRADRAAALKAVPMLLSAGVGGRIVLLPDGEDPDTLVRNGGAEALDALIANAVPLFDAILNDAAADYDGTVPGKATVISKIKPVFRLLDESESGEYVRRLSRLLGMWESELTTQLGGTDPSPGPPGRPGPDMHGSQSAPRGPQAPGPERKLLALLIRRSDELLPHWMARRDRSTLVTSPTIGRILDMAWDIMEEHEELRGGEFLERLDAAGMGAAAKGVARILVREEDPWGDEFQKAFDDLVADLTKREAARQENRQRAGLAALSELDQLKAIREKYSKSAIPVAGS